METEIGWAKGLIAEPASALDRVENVGVRAAP